MSVLVFGGTGKVGSVAVRHLIEKNLKVRVFSHSPDKFNKISKQVEIIEGDLDNPNTIPPALVDIEDMILILGVHADEQERGLSVINAAKNSNIKRIIYLSFVHDPGTERVPFYKSKLVPFKGLLYLLQKQYPLLIMIFFISNNSKSSV